jgi:uncharacterized delta-60 repeat protein
MKRNVLLLLLFSLLGIYNTINAQTTLLSEGFESSTQFTVNDVDGDGNTWFISNTSGWPKTGSNCIGVTWNPAGNNDFLITPFINLPTATTINFSFYAKSIDSAFLESFNIGVSTDGTNFTTIANETSVPSNYTQFSYDLTTYAGQSIKVAIICVSVDKYYLVVDDILCTSSSSGSITLPTITTTVISSVTSTSAVSGGNVISDGGANVTSRGICYSTCPNPTYVQNPTSDGTGTGIFTSNITDLKANTTYYVRAYATNSVGTTYGNNISFTTTEAISSGPLDVTFGNTGIITTHFCYGDDYGQAMVIQSDGKIIVAGYTEVSDFDFAVIRYNSDGTLDYTFGTEGKVITDFSNFNNSDDRAYAITIQSDGKIVVAGRADQGTCSFALARYNTNGTLDNTFGSGGKVTTSIGTGTNYDEAFAIDLQADGKIVASGYTKSGGSYKKFVSVRYNINGSIDNTFGTSGIVISSLGASNDIIHALKIQSDGKIIVAGSSTQTYGDNIAIVRYNTNGSFDNTFGTNGIKLINAGPYPYSHQCRAYALDIQTDGKIVVAGMDHSQFAAVRCNSDGSLDNSFGTGGQVVTQVSDANHGNEAYAVKIQSDGKIILVGYSKFGSLYMSDIALVRYNADGTIDNSFGTNGIIVTPVSTYADGANSVAIQSDGRIVIAGYTLGPNNYDIVLVRYDNLITEVKETKTVSQKNNFTIYPNPANDHITIDFGDSYTTMNGYMLTITNLLSQIVYTTSINTQSTTVDLSSWTGNGIYFVQLIDASNNTIDIRKIVLQ